MIRKIKRVNALQLGKMLGVLYGLLSLIFVPFIVLFAVLSSHPTPIVMPIISGQSIPPIVQINPMPMTPWLVMAVLFPIAYAVMGFIGGIIAAWIYNIVAVWVGGIEVEVE